MADPSQVFIITTGSYSDYRIQSVWMTEAEAQAVVDEAVAKNTSEWFDIRYDGPRIEVYGVGLVPPTVADHQFFCFVQVEDDGTVSVNGEGEGTETTLEPEGITIDDRPWTQGHVGVGIMVSYRDRERAAKVYSEVKAQTVHALTTGVPVAQLVRG